MQGICQEYTGQLSDTRQEESRFSRNGSDRAPRIKDKCVFEKIDRSLNRDSVAVKVIPMLGITRDAGIKAEIFIWISIDTFSIGRICTRVFTGANSLVSYCLGFRADPLEPQRAILTGALTEENEFLLINRADWSPGRIETGILFFGISGIHGDTGSTEMEIIFEHRVGFI